MTANLMIYFMRHHHYPNKISLASNNRYKINFYLRQLHQLIVLANRDIKPHLPTIKNHFQISQNFSGNGKVALMVSNKGKLSNLMKTQIIFQNVWRAIYMVKVHKCLENSLGLQNLYMTS